MEFHVGQKVVCVDDSPIEDGRSALVMRGAIYTISEIVMICRHPGYGVRLVELTPYPGKGGWLPSRFRPVTERKTDISIFTELLIGAPKELERVD